MSGDLSAENDTSLLEVSEVCLASVEILVEKTLQNVCTIGGRT